MFSTAYLTGADWNDTRFFNDKFDGLVKSARTELDSAKRKAIYREAAVILHEEGGLICPMFNDFIDASTDKIDGYAVDPSGQLMNGFALSKCWLKA